MKHVFSIAIVAAAVATASCAGDPGASGANALVEVGTEPPGESCATGGLRIDTGLDDGAGGETAADGVLGAGEIDATEYVCNGDPGGSGEAGTDGADGTEALIEVTEELAGANCASGGQRIDTGLDDGASGETANDGILGEGEIDATAYICNGTDGADGAEALIEITDEPAGANCEAGGQRIDTGLDDGAGDDTAGDGILGSDELDATDYVCSGTDGAASLIATTDEPTGANCVFGGLRVDTGLDDGDGGETADDGILGAGEIDATSYVCDNTAAESWPAGDGILQGMSLALLEDNGWTVCHQDVYADVIDDQGVMAGCQGEYMMLACRNGATDALTLAAADTRDVVTQVDAASEDAFHEANGVGWYYSDNFSWGFFPASETVSRSSCDFGGSLPEQRLCWHTSGGTGYRCGDNVLNGNATWQRLVLVK